MDDLPCSPVVMTSINFDGLQDIIKYFVKKLTSFDQNINDLNKKVKETDNIKENLDELTIKFQNKERIITELENRVNNYNKILL